MNILEQAINRYLSLDPELPGKLGQFEGKVICLDITGTGQRLYMLPHTDRIEVKASFDGEVDATLRGSPFALFKMSMARDVAPMLLKGEVEIVGDMRTGRAFKSLLATMKIDWEEQLSALTGDIAAHEIMKAVKGIGEWGRRSGESLAMDVSEYLQEESRDVVTGAEIQRFCDGVDELRAGADRLEARLARLARGRAD